MQICFRAFCYIAIKPPSYAAIQMSRYAIRKNPAFAGPSDLPLEEVGKTPERIGLGLLLREGDGLAPFHASAEKFTHGYPLASGICEDLFLSARRAEFNPNLPSVEDQVVRATLGAATVADGAVIGHK